MSIESHQVERIKTSWMLNGIQCWARVGAQENSNLMFRKAIITGLDNKREHALLKYDFNFIQIQEQKENGPEKVHVRDLLECKQNQSNEKNKEGFADMVGMNILNEAEILNNVWLRYTNDLIFTYIGPTLLVMNPYKKIENLFNNQMLSEFQKPAVNSTFDIKQHQPHVYAVTTLAYQQLFMNQKNQAIVISGESGAGKTENAKYCMNFLTSLSNETKSQRSKKKGQQGNNQNTYSTMRCSTLVNSNTFETQQSDSAMKTSIEERILRCNPILEAFGNAKTVRNDNSSRFGKYVRIWIGKQDQRIKGASISNYLLEKSRVTLLSQGERNYHIFYHFIQGLEISQLKKYKLTEGNNQRIDMKKFNYLNQSNVYDISSFESDTEMLNSIQESFNKMEIDSYQQNAIFKVLSAILYIGNIEFDSSTYTDNTPCKIKNPEIVKLVAELLEISEEEKITKSMIFKIRQVGSQVMETPVNVEECKINRDSLARALYDKMFSWIVQSLNMIILPKIDKDLTLECLSLGLLDIFGFENFQTNSFEQLCINYTNERLQQLYIIYVFKAEEEEFKKEGLQVHSLQLSYEDNQVIIDVMDKPPNGIFDLCDESCSLGNSTDEKYYQKIVSTYAKNDIIKIPKIQNMKFTIIHTAKEVEYYTEGFRNKNKDEISTFLDACIQSSSNSEICSIWQGISDALISEMDNTTRQTITENTMSVRQSMSNKKNEGKNKKFLGAKFRQQMKDLMGELNSCDVHFIRCIKPNEDKIKEKFVSSYVLLQIRYLGLLESIKVRRQGFPCRMNYNEFYTKFHEIDSFNRKISLQTHLGMNSDMRGLCKELLFRVVQDINKKEVLFGETKIYLKIQPSAELDLRLIKWWKYKNDQVIKVQNQWEVHTNRKIIKESLKSLLKKKQAFVKLQAIVKMKKQRKAYLQTLNFKKGLNILQKVQMKMQQGKLKEALSRWADKIKIAKKGAKWSNSIAKICQISKKNSIKDIREYWERWKNHVKLEQEKDLQKKQNEHLPTIIPEEQKEDEESLEEEKKDEVKEMPEEKKSPEKKKVNPNGLEMESEDIKSDEFTAEGLKIWPNFTTFTKPENLKDKFSIPNDTLNNKQKYLNIQKPQINVDGKEYSDFSNQFIFKAKKLPFLEFCEQHIKRAKNFNKKTAISKIMQFQSGNLSESMLDYSTVFNGEATKIFRSILKIAGNRNSRFSTRYHSDLIISLCLGKNGNMDSNNYILFKKSENPEEQQSQKDKNGKRESKLNIHNNDRRDSNLAKYQSQVAKKMNNQDNNLNNIDAPESLIDKAQSLLQNELNPLKDEVFFQLCKQIVENKTQKAKKNLFKFASEMATLFAPSPEALFPLINFFMEQTDLPQNFEYRDTNKYIVNRLSEYARGYAILSQKNPKSLSKERILNEDIVLKENDPLQQDLKELDNQHTFSKYLQKMEPRQLIPSQSEILKIHYLKQICIKVYLFNDTYIYVPMDPLDTVKIIVQKACAQIDMKERYQFFSLYEVAQQEGVVKHEAFAKDNHKIMDVYNSHKNAKELALKQQKKKIQFKIYLRIRIYYKLFREDVDSISMFYMQNVFEVSQGRLPLTYEEQISLAAHYCYSITHAPESGHKYMEEVVQQTAPKSSQINVEKWISDVRQVYQKLAYTNVIEARWNYLEILRPLDLFLSYQFKCRMFEQEKTEQGYRSKLTQDVVLGIRPLQIIISDLQLKTIYIIDFSEMTKWGQSLSNKSYFLIQHENNNLFVFEIQDTELSDYLINAYVNWKLERNIDDDSNPTYNDVVTFVINPEDDKKNRIQ